MPSILLAPPVLEPITLAEAKAHLRVAHADEDQLISTLIVAARRLAEAQTGLLFVAQQWQCLADDWPDNGVISLPVAPVVAIEEVASFGDDDVKSVIDPAHYYADLPSRPPRLMLRGSRVWARPGRIANGVVVTVTAGFGAAASDVPEPLRHAVRLMIGHWFDHRGDDDPPSLPLTVSTLLTPFRETRL